MSAPVQLSILLPLRDGAAIPELYIAVTTACERLGRAHELLFIDDGTRDGSGPILDALVDEAPRVRVVHLRRPLGRNAALSAGFARARADIGRLAELDVFACLQNLHRSGLQTRERDAVRAGRNAFLSGVMVAQDTAQPSTPVLGTPFWHHA